MVRASLTATVLAVSLVPAVPSVAQAPCGEWRAGLFPPGDLDGRVDVLAVFDDTSGLALVAGGAFLTAGGGTVNAIARWNGSAWSAFGGGLDADVFAIVIFDDGSGPALIAGGAFTGGVARFDGTAWSTLGGGLDGTVRALIVFDDGSGPQLVAGGSFTSGIATFDGATWSTLGTGLDDGTVASLATFDDGSGSTLYAGGSFTSVSGVAASHVARWNGTTWTALDAGTSDVVRAFLVHDDGSGAALYVGGDFDSAGGLATNGIARWNGSAWSALGAGVGPAGSSVQALATFDDGAGPVLHAGGSFDSAGGLAAARIARWSGIDWSALGGGIGSPTDVQPSVFALTVFDDGTGPGLFAGGNFTAAGSAASAPLAAWHIVAPPAIQSDPTSRVACEGEPITFTVGAGGSAPLAYQWRKDGVDIGGANGDSLTIVATTAGDAGAYDVVLSNVCGSATSAAATLTVHLSPSIDLPPADASTCPGATIVLDVIASGTEPLSYRWRQNGADVAGATGNSLTLVGVTSVDAGSYDVVVSNACASRTSEPATVTVLVEAAIAVQPTGQTACESSAVSFDAVASGTGPIAYRWRRNGVDISGATSPTYSIASVGIGDAADYDVVVTNACGSATSDTATLVVSSLPTIDQPPADASTCAGGTIALDVAAHGSEPLAFQWRKNGIGVAGANGTSLTIVSASAADSGHYDVVVSTPLCSITSAAATVAVLVPPTIVVQPTSRTVCRSGVVAFLVVANGSEPIAYQWRRNGIDIAGATASTLSINPVLTTDAAAYDVVVSNTCGTVTSGAATLTVRTAPSVTSSPSSQSVCAGSPLTLHVTATGSAPLRYQWRRNGNPIAGARSSTVTITSAAIANAGNYDCLVGNGCGVVASATATLGVFTLAPTRVDVDPTVLVGGGSVAGAVTITCAAPTGGVTVALESSDSLVAMPPAGVVVPEGALVAPFVVATNSVASTTLVTITASIGGQTTTTAMKLLDGGSECLTGAGAEALYYFDSLSDSGLIDMSATKSFDVLLADIDGSALQGNEDVFLVIEDHGTGSGDEALATRVRHDFFGLGGHLLESDDLGLATRSTQAFAPGQVPGTFDIDVQLAQNADGQWTITPAYRLPGGASTPFDGGAWTTDSSFDLTSTRIAVRIDPAAGGRLCYRKPAVVNVGCLAGNVNAGLGAIRDVLRVNGSTGHASRRVTVAANAPITLALDAAPAGSGGGEYVVWAWLGPLAPLGYELAFDDVRVGCVVNPTPFHPGATPRAFYCVRGGLPPAFGAGLHELVGSPARVPFSVRRGRGLAMPATVTLQGVLHDEGSSSSERLSVTNAIVLVVQ